MRFVRWKESSHCCLLVRMILVKSVVRLLVIRMLNVTICLWISSIYCIHHVVSHHGAQRQPSAIQ